MKNVNLNSHLSIGLISNRRIYCHSPTSTPTQLKRTQKNKDRAELRKQKLLVYINKAQKSFQVRPQPKDSPIGPKKAQNDPKKAKNEKVGQQKILQNKSYQY